MAKKNYEQIRVDLRPYGWGIRDVDVIPPETELGPDSVGSEEIKDEGVQMQDLASDVQEKINNPKVSPEAVSEAVNAVVPDAVSSAVSEAVPAAVADKLDAVTEEQFNRVFGNGGDSSDSSSSE